MNHNGSNLLVDVGLLNKGIEDIEHAMDVPHLRILLQDLDLLRRTALKLTTELHKGLKLQKVRGMKL